MRIQGVPSPRAILPSFEMLMGHHHEVGISHGKTKTGDEKGKGSLLEKL